MKTFWKSKVLIPEFAKINFVVFYSSKVSGPYCAIHIHVESHFASLVSLLKSMGLVMKYSSTQCE